VGAWSCRGEKAREECSKQADGALLPDWSHHAALLALQRGDHTKGIAMRPAHPAYALSFAAGTFVLMAAIASAQGRQVEGWQGYAAEIAANVRRLGEAADIWARGSYARKPAVMLGLAGALGLPPLALAGYFLYRRRPGEVSSPGLEPEVMQGSAAAWIEIEGAERIAMPQSRDFIQIGRLEDNDVCLDDDSVHRYHAVIERSARQGFVIVDISGPAGNGVVVNGERCARSNLADGDMVEVGKSRLRFATAA
jgi:hypothetical protein